MRTTGIMFGLVGLAAISGCAHDSAFPLSREHLEAGSTPAQAVMPVDAPVPMLADLPYLPSPASPREPTYNLTATHASVREVLSTLARESGINLDIHPGVVGKVTIHAVEQTLPAIMERISKQVDVRYKIMQGTLVVEPDTPVLRTYRVDYVNMERDTSAVLGVGSEISSGGSQNAGGATTSVAGGSASGSRSVTTISSKSKTNFWELLGENIRHILKSTQSRQASVEERVRRNEANRLSGEERLRQVEAVSRAGSGAEKLYHEAFKSGASPADGREDVIANPLSGSVTVLATERQHEDVRRHIDAVMAAVQRQVLIEATIVEVVLNDTFKTGVDWSRLGSNGELKGFTLRQNLTGTANLLQSPATVGAGASVLGTPGFILGYNNSAGPLGNIAASISWLQTFGDTRVLSSPKIMALNNQSALLKVVDNTVYFKVEVTPATLSATGSVLTPAIYTTTPQNISVGVVMSVTPQINENGSVSLNIRPTISRIINYVTDPNPDLAKAGVSNQVPQIQVREMESVLQVNTGQTVVLGGLMQDDWRDSDKKLPGLAGLPLVGKLFQSRDDTRKKTELVIFLRPTVLSSGNSGLVRADKTQAALPRPP